MTLTAQTPVNITHESGARKQILFLDFLLALGSRTHQGYITIGHAHYKLDTFTIEVPQAPISKKRKRKAKVATPTTKPPIGEPPEKT